MNALPELVARNRKAAARRKATAQAQLEARMAGAARGSARGDYSVAEILARVRAKTGRDAARFHEGDGIPRGASGTAREAPGPSSSGEGESAAGGAPFSEARGSSADPRAVAGGAR